MHSPCISEDSFLSACEYTAPIHSTCQPPNTSLLRVRWTPAHILHLSYTNGCHIPGKQLLQVARGATSTRSSCKLCSVQQKRTASHFFPHTRPPDTHLQFSPPHTTFTHALEVGAACLAYQRLLVNSYCTFDPCRPRGRARPPSASCDRRTFALTSSGVCIDLTRTRPQQNV